MVWNTTLLYFTTTPLVHLLEAETYLRCKDEEPGSSVSRRGTDGRKINANIKSYSFVRLFRNTKMATGTGNSDRLTVPGGSSNSGADTGGASSSQPKRKRMFSRDLKFMMHGFGDDLNPYEETVDLVEDLVVEFISETTLKAMEVGKKGKIHVDDILFLVRKDPKKYTRVKDLLNMNEELKKAKQIFDDSEYT